MKMESMINLQGRVAELKVDNHHKNLQQGLQRFDLNCWSLNCFTTVALYESIKPVLSELPQLFSSSVKNTEHSSTYLF